MSPLDIDSMLTGINRKRGDCVVVIDKSDDYLLKAISRDRDQLAFKIFYERHSDRGYRLASFTLGDPGRAEEAVQDASFTVWSSAHTYEAGNARGWFLKIVANKCANLMKKTRRRERRMERYRDRNRPQTVRASDPVAREELLHSLRELMERLSPGERQLVSLYYVAGLSQKEVAKSLSLPQSTVAFRMSKVLETLRSKLSVGGYAATMPVLSDELIQRVILSGPGVPTRLGDVVFEAIAQNRGTEVLTSQGGSPLGSVKLWVLSGLCLTLVSGGAWWSQQPAPRKQQRAALPKAVAPTPIIQPQANVEAQPTSGILKQKGSEESTQRLSRHLRWDMRSAKPPVDILLTPPTAFTHALRGGSDKSGVVDGKGGGKLRVKITAWTFPVQLSWRSHSLISKNVSQPIFTWLDVMGALPDLKGERHETRVKLVPGKWQSYTCFVTEHYVDFWCDGRRVGFSSHVLLQSPHRVHYLDVSPMLLTRFDWVDALEIQAKDLPATNDLSKSFPKQIMR